MYMYDHIRVHTILYECMQSDPSVCPFIHPSIHPSIHRMHPSMHACNAHTHTQMFRHRNRIKNIDKHVQSFVIILCY